MYTNPHVWKEIEKETKYSTIYPGFPSLFPYPWISVGRSRGTCAVSLPSLLLDAPWTSPKMFFPWRFLMTRAIGQFFGGSVKVTYDVPFTRITHN